MCTLPVLLIMDEFAPAVRQTWFSFMKERSLEALVYLFNIYITAPHYDPWLKIKDFSARTTRATVIHEMRCSEWRRGMSLSDTAERKVLRFIQGVSPVVCSHFIDQGQRCWGQELNVSKDRCFEKDWLCGQNTKSGYQCDRCHVYIQTLPKRKSPKKEFRVQETEQVVSKQASQVASFMIYSVHLASLAYYNQSI